MKEFLTPQNIREIDPKPKHEYKFVRVGKIFVYGSGDELHSDLAEMIPDVKYDEDFTERPIVDDAGLVLVINKKISFAGFSSSCQMPEDKDQARIETEQIALSEFGIELIN